jgi:hypothetical protein
MFIECSFTINVWNKICVWKGLGQNTLPNRLDLKCWWSLLSAILPNPSKKNSRLPDHLLMEHLVGAESTYFPKSMHDNRRGGLSNPTGSRSSKIYAR